MTDHYKLVHFYGTKDDYQELFDLKTDPLEMRSVFGEAPYAEAQNQLEQKLARLRTELKVPEKTPPEWFGKAPSDHD